MNSTEENDDDLIFEPCLFDDSKISWKSASDTLYSEIDAIRFLRNLPEPIEPFWLRPPVLNPDQVRKLYRLAEVLVTFCREEKIPIWIDGGSLLGAVRHRALIPWDDDVDFSMMKSDSKRFVQRIVPRLRESGYGVLDWWYGGYRVFPIDGDPISESGLSNGQQCKYPFADIFWMHLDKRESLETLVYWDYRARCLWPSGLTFDELWPLRDYEFGPLSLPGPNRYERHLDSLYGSDWPNVVYQTREGHREGSNWNPMKIRVKLDRFPAVIPL